MSGDNEPEMTQEKTHEQEVNAPNAPGATTPESEVSPAVANFRQGILTESRRELMLALGEEPQEYQGMMESLLEDLQPRRGLESHLVEQMGETFWRMRRAQRVRDGLALKSIRRKVEGEEMVATMQASKVFEALEPFERLKEALSRRGQGPTAAEIDEFVKTRKGDSSEKMQEFILLLKSLKEPREEQERKAALREARKHLGPLMETYENLAWQYTRKSERVHSSENLAALMAPEDKHSAHLQRMEDSYLRRMWRIINAFGKVRQGALQKKDVKKTRSKPVCV
jgi:hypothetical protein